MVEMIDLIKLIKSRKLSLITFFVTGILLSLVQIKVSLPAILLERFIKGGGWIEILLLSVYASFVIHRMKDPGNIAYWRRLTWAAFSAVFFLQLIIGLFGFERFLMTGRLHFPIPALIILGMMYRMKISFMPVLFISTVVLSGPAWCSHLCYFGALDNLAASGRMGRLDNLAASGRMSRLDNLAASGRMGRLDNLAASGRMGRNVTLRNKNIIKHSILGLAVPFTVVLRALKLPVLYAVISAGILGVAGVFIIVFISSRKKKMVHCVTYCPIGTIVMYLKYISPFRMFIDDRCNECMRCSSHCKYDALNVTDIKKRRPGLSCTYCGDCVAVCKSGSIKYRFFNMSPEKARNFYLIISISLHAVFFGLARI